MKLQSSVSHKARLQTGSALSKNTSVMVSAIATAKTSSESSCLALSAHANNSISNFSAKWAFFPNPITIIDLVTNISFGMCRVQELQNYGDRVQQTWNGDSLFASVKQPSHFLLVYRKHFAITYPVFIICWYLLSSEYRKVSPKSPHLRGYNNRTTISFNFTVMVYHFA